MRVHRRFSTRLLTIFAIGALALQLLPPFAPAVRVAAAGVAPLLVVTNTTTSPFGNYLQEILNAEGVKDYEVLQLSAVTSSTLAGRRAVLLGEANLTTAQATLLDNFVSGGGGLVAMRPATELNATLGVTRQSTTLAEGYVRINDPTFGAGLYTDTMQFHGTSSRYTLAGATQVAELYSDRSTTVGQPAVTIATRGSGQAALFSYDLARSVALTRQGNPANADLDVDGDGVIRTIDLFKGWIDLERTRVPQADMQQRLLIRLIQTVMAQPVPRLWYFPNAQPTVVVATGDAHANPDSYYQTEIDALRQIGATATFYISPAGNPGPAQMASWRALGFDFAPHPYVDCGYGCGFDNAFNWFESTYNLAARTIRTHQVRWSGWTDAASIEATHGVALDFNQYQWGPWLKTAAGDPALGYTNGSGQPMRFVDANGTILPIYQQHTLLVDEDLAPQAGEQGLSLNEALAASYQTIDDSINGYYSPITTQYHVDYFYPDNSAWAIQTTQYAMQHGASSLNADTWLTFIQQRAATTISGSTWSGNTLSFSVGAGGTGQTILLPLQYGGRTLAGIQVGGSATTFTTMNVNGIPFAALSVRNGTYVATYAADTIAPTVTGKSPTAGATNVPTSTPITLTFSEAMNRTATQGAFALSPTTAGAFAWDNTGTTMTFTPSTPLTATTAYTATIGTGATDLAGNPLAGPTSWGFTTATVTPPPSVSAVSPISGPIAGGTTVTISGSSFSGTTAVAFGDTAATSFTVVSDTTITATAPAHATGTVDVTVTTPIGTSAIGTAARYTYLDQSAALAITAVDPGTGTTAGGTTVGIVGANFATGATVTFGGQPATAVTVSSTTTIVATTPAHAAGVVNVIVTTPDGHSATLTGGYSYVPCPTACVTQTTLADFGTGTTDAGAALTQTADGEVQLAPTNGTEFSGTALPAGWLAAPWSAGGGSTVGGGALTVDGALIATNAYYGPGRSIEFVATFSGSAPYQHIGLGSDLNSAPWAIFSTGSLGGALYARTNSGAGQTETLLNGNWLDAPHLFRIEWTASSITYLIDGTQVATHTVAIGGDQRPVISDGSVGGGTLTVDWLRVSPFASAGTFTSRVFDAGGTTTWGSAAWSAAQPQGTTLAVRVRTGNTPTPDGTWTAYTALTNGATVGANARYLQYQLALATTVPDRTPTLRDLTIGYSVTGPLAPSITSIAPNAGVASGGTAVTITGTTFATGATVSFGGVAGTNVVRVSATSITANTPAHAAGAVDVIVNNPDGTSGTLAGGYTYTAAAPTVTGLSPASGPTTGGTSVTIAGTGFAGTTAVTFGGTPAASFAVTSDTAITATAPAHAAGAITVTVTTPSGTTATSATSTFTYQAPAPAPQVLQVSPGTGPATGGMTIAITGINLSGATSVTFGAAAATNITVTSDTTLTATLPTGAAGTVDVRVTTASGPSPLAAGARFTYVSCPSGCMTQTTVAHFASGSASGTYITRDEDGEITLAPGAGAEFDGTALPAGWSAAPWATGGAATVTGDQLVVDGALVTTDGYFNTGRVLEFSATFDPTAPSQHIGLGIDLNGAPWAIFSTAGGGTLYARSNGGSGQYDTTLPGNWLGARHRFRITWTATTIDYAIDGTTLVSHPIGATGDMRPVISDGPVGGGVLRLDWLRLGPYATSGTYTSGVLDAGGSATWQTAAWSADLPTGTTLTVSLRAGNTPTPDATWSAFTPVTNGGTAGIGGRYLQYRLDLGTSDPSLTPRVADLTIGYAANGSAAPILTGISPTGGPTTGGTTVTLTGTGLTGATAVTFGGTPATGVAVVSDTTVTATAPAHAAGSVAVAVTTPGGTSAPGAGGTFTYQTAAPTVSGLAPASGPLAGGTTVTITGTTLTGATAVTFGGTPAASFAVTNDTTIIATTPAHAAGTIAVLVVTPGGTTTANAASQFTYLLPPPTVTQLAPATGPATGGGTVLIRGTDLSGATSVTFGGTPASNISAISDTLISATAPAHVAGVVDVRVTTASGTSATAANARFTYVACPNGCRTQSTQSDFATGALTNTTVTLDLDGEVTLAPALNTDFSGTTLPTNFTATPWSSGGGATVSDGQLHVDGALVTANSYVAPGRSLEFVATFDATTPFQHVGLGIDLNNTPWAIFSTGSSGGTLYARSNASGGQIDTPLGGGWLGAPHRFRIDWTSTGLVYLIDGNQVASHTIGNTGDLRPVFSDSAPGGATLSVDWLRLGPYATTGDYTSTVFDAGSQVRWQTGAWTADVPNGTTLAISVRSGDTPLPDGTWTTFAPVANGASSNAQGRYFQYQATLTTSDPLVTPTLSDFTIGYSAASVPTPTVTELSPTSGPTTGGTAVTLTGTGFTGATAVTFGGTPATGVTVVSDTTVTAVSPAHAAGSVAVAVTTPGGTSAPGAGGTFTYQAPPPQLAAPTVTGLSPASGPTTGGTSVTIAGTGFAGTTAVTFGGTPAASFAVTSDTVITATAPAHAVGNAAVAITAPGGTSAPGAGGTFTYQAPPPQLVAPTVTELSPTGGPTTGGTAVTLTGTGFTGATAVTFGGTPATGVTVVSDTTVTAVSPAHAAGSVAVAVTTPGGTSAPGAGGTFTYQAPPPQLAAPTVTGLSPADGPIDGGTTVTITGTDLTGATAVTFGGSAATSVTVVSDTTVTAVSPAHATGVTDLLVTTPGGTSVAGTGNRFTYIAPPSVTALSPTSGPTSGGTTVTLTGTDFTGATVVTFGTTPATNVTVTSATSLTAVTPAGSSVVNVTVTTPYGVSASATANRYTYNVAPTITTVAPTSGPAAGGTSVTISGTNFVAGLDVTFGGVAATGVTVTSATSLTANTPARPAGAVTIVVTNPDGQSASRASGFTYLAGPTITTLSPTAGLATGNTLVTITGTNFISGGLRVTFDGLAATSVTLQSPTSLTVRTPAHAIGVVPVIVTTSNGVSSSAQYTYGAPPTITTVTPNSGPLAGGNTVTIGGTNLAATTGVLFGTTTAAITATTATTVTVTVPSRTSAGTVTIQLTTPFGSVTTSTTRNYTYVAPPTVLLIAPNTGSTSGGTTVTIFGSGFTGATRVAFGAVNATSFTVISDTRITVTAPAQAASTVDIRVTAIGGTSSAVTADRYRYTGTSGNAQPAATDGNRAIRAARSRTRRRGRGRST